MSCSGDITEILAEAELLPALERAEFDRVVDALRVIVSHGGRATVMAYAMVGTELELRLRNA